MAKDLSKEQKLAAYVDDLLSGRPIDWNNVDPELRAELDFAARMLANRDEAPLQFRNSLRSRLLNKIARGDYAKAGLSEKLKMAFSGAQAIRIAAGVAVVMLIIAGSVVWATYSSKGSQTAMAPAAPAAAPGATSGASAGGSYVLNLPANNVPVGLKVSNSVALSTSPAQAKIYQVQAPHVTSETVKELGNKLGMKGEAVYEGNGNRITMRSGSGNDARELTVWVASGAKQYGYTDLNLLYPSVEPSLPSPDKAKEAAYNFLNKLALLPPGYPDYNKVQATMQVVPVNAPASRRGGLSSLLVKFPYLVDGLQASGPGARIEVIIGTGGNPLSFLVAWRSLVSFSATGIISPDSAYRNLINGQGSLDVPANTSTYNINEVDLSYWIEPYTEIQTAISPVYLFKGKSLDSRGNLIEEVDAWSSALH
jgi:hypothetical protein